MDVSQKILEMVRVLGEMVADAQADLEVEVFYNSDIKLVIGFICLQLTLNLQLTTFSDSTRSRDLFKIGMFALLKHLLHLLPGKSRRRRRGEMCRMW